MTFGLMLPVLMLAGGYTVDYAEKVSATSNLQGIADAAALAAAREIALANSNPGQIQQVAENHASAHSGSGGNAHAAGELLVKAAVIDDFTGVQVKITKSWKSSFGKLFGEETSTATADATAHVVGNTKICVLGLMQYGVLAGVHLDNSAKLTAADCGVYSNSVSPFSIRADKSSEMTAHLICAAGGTLAGGTVAFTPEPVTDCPQIPDPLSSRPAPPVGACTDTDTVVDTDTILTPGVYCGGLRISGSASVDLQPGIYVIKDGPFIVEGEASLTGEYVSFYMSGDAAIFSFDRDTEINLGAPKEGPMAGLLFYEKLDPNLSGSAFRSLFSTLGDLAALGSMRTHRIRSNNARQLLGTFYLPNSILKVDANGSVADASAYTAIVVRRLWLLEGPNLVLNANYAATDVPVPSTIAGAEVRLTD
ncbi:MAG: pilus assembly protein TadG-related protein [Pseudomonadota bacterium]